MQLQLQLQLQDEMMNRLFTCKIKEHKDFNLVMEGLEGLVNSSYRCMFSSYRWVYSCNYNCKYKSKRIVCVNIWSRSKMNMLFIGEDGFYPMKMIYNSNLNLVMEGLENSSYRCMFSSYSCVNIWSKRIV